MRSRNLLAVRDGLDGVHGGLTVPKAHPELHVTIGAIQNEEIRDGMRKAARDSDLKTVPVFVTS